MTHPITPPPELSDEQVGEWLIDDGYPWDPSEQAVITITTNRLKHVACQAFQAGADQELEACCDVLHQHDRAYFLPSQLRAARRPEPQNAPMTDFRALCTELLCSLEQYPVQPPRDCDLIDRARAALAEPEEQEPTDEELDAVWDEEAGYFALYVETKRFARAVLARWGCQ